MSEQQLGTIVTFAVPKVVPLATLRQALKEAGQDEELAGEMRYENATKRALAEMSKGRIIRKLRHDGDEVHFQLTLEVLADRLIEYVREAEVTVDCSNGIAYCRESNEIQDLVQKLLNEHLEKRMTGDMTRMVQRIFERSKGDLIPIREQGGVYFVPDHLKHLVDSVDTLLTKIGGRLGRFAVAIGDARTRQSVAEDLAAYLYTEIGELEKRCLELGEDSRTYVFNRRLDELGQQCDKLKHYRGLLLGLSDVIDQKYQETQRVAAEHIRKTLAAKREESHA